MDEVPGNVSRPAHQGESDLKEHGDNEEPAPAEAQVGQAHDVTVGEWNRQGPQRHDQNKDHPVEPLCPRPDGAACSEYRPCSWTT